MENFPYLTNPRGVEFIVDFCQYVYVLHCKKEVGNRVDPPPSEGKFPTFFRGDLRWSRNESHMDYGVSLVES